MLRKTNMNMMTVKEIMAYVPKANRQTVTSFCLSTIKHETVAESIEWDVQCWLEDIMKGKIVVENGVWSKLPFYGTTEGTYELTEEGDRQARNRIFEKRIDYNQEEHWRTPSFKSSFRIMKTYWRGNTAKWDVGFLPTAAQVKKALENIAKEA